MIQNRLKLMKLRTIMVVLFASPSAAMATNKTGIVTVQQTVARETASFLSNSKFKLSYGDSVTILQEKGLWAEISTEKQTGWIPKSTLGSDRAIQKEAGRGKSTDISVYRNETVTAGKGFSPEYEQMIRNENAQIDYGVVDELEKQDVGILNLNQFARDAGLDSDVFK
ncbi:MAG: hypothetical protein EBR09_12080 [Proteobacteria bacterium]|nr:hypothetical protein [Pseudomonadota bacterium]